MAVKYLRLLASQAAKTFGARVVPTSDPVETLPAALISRDAIQTVIGAYLAVYITEHMSAVFLPTVGD